MPMPRLRCSPYWCLLAPLVTPHPRQDTYAICLGTVLPAELGTDLGVCGGAAGGGGDLDFPLCCPFTWPSALCCPSWALRSESSPCPQALDSGGSTGLGEGWSWCLGGSGVVWC